MAISHLCTSCGLDVARVRALREPLYGLPLVTCPRCGVHAVRRRHPLIARWRQILRLKTSVLVMLVQAALAVGLTLGTVGACIIWAQRWLGGGIDVGDERIVAGMAVGFLCLPAALGLWLTAGLGHWRAGTQWAVFAAVVTALLSLDTVVAPAVMHGLVAVGGEEPPLPWGFEHLFVRGMILGLVLIVAAAGVAPGRLLMLGFARFRAARWRARRRRFRARRSHG
jgi:hypothetical protein